MSAGAGDQFYARRAGTGGRPDQWEIWTGGDRRFIVRGLEAAVEFVPVVATPFAPTRLGAGVYFFRDRGDGKAQFCVRFPSGATQILATEP